MGSPRVGHDWVTYTTTTMTTGYKENESFVLILALGKKEMLPWLNIHLIRRIQWKEVSGKY